MPGSAEAPLILRIAATWEGHPVGPNEEVRFELSGEVGGLRVVVEAPFHDDPAPAGPAGPTDQLWSFEVVELFVLEAGSERYLEVELGPHGHHLVLELDGARKAIRTKLPIEFSVRVSGARWTGRALLPWDLLPAAPHRVNAYAIHGQGEGRRYLAWTAVPGDGPDFHRLDRFAECELPKPPR